MRPVRSDLRLGADPDAVLARVQARFGIGHAEDVGVSADDVLPVDMMDDVEATRLAIAKMQLKTS